MADTFQALTGKATCTACPDGKWTDGKSGATSAAACVAKGCPAGKFYAAGRPDNCPEWGTGQCTRTKAGETCEQLPLSTHKSYSSRAHPVTVCASTTGYVVSGFVKSTSGPDPLQKSAYYRCHNYAGGGWGAHQSSMVKYKYPTAAGDFEGAKWKKTGSTTATGYFFFPSFHTYGGYSNCEAVAIEGTCT